LHAKAFKIKDGEYLSVIKLTGNTKRGKAKKNAKG
jgi:hypothetical protein